MKDTSYLNQADNETTALVAIGWIVSEPARADRLLALTGLNPDSLRDSLGDRATLAALLGVLVDHEPDLLACARDSALDPAQIVAARQGLAQ